MSPALDLALGLGLLLAGAELLVRGAAALGLRAGLSPLVVGLTIVAMATSSPELAVSLGAALQGTGGLAAGNVVGSNIFNVAAILGATALLRPLRVQAAIVRIDAPVVIACSLLLVLLLADHRLGRADGLLLLALLLAYLAYTLRQSRRESAQVVAEFAAGVMAPPRAAWMEVLLVLAGLALLLGGARLFVTGAVALATAAQISPAVIGLTVAAAGTSLPELATSLVAAWRGQDDIAIGNVVGSNIFNILAILGSTALVAPVDQGGLGTMDLAMLCGTALVLWPMIYTQLRIDRWEGAVLLAGYLGYLAWLL